MKKKFRDTKFGKLLTNRFVKMAIKAIPLVGGPLGNILDDTTVKETTSALGTHRIIEGSEPGGLSGDEWTALIGSVILGGLLVYALITGDWEGAEKGKGFID